MTTTPCSDDRWSCECGKTVVRSQYQSADQWQTYRLNVQLSHRCPDTVLPR